MCVQTYNSTTILKACRSICLDFVAVNYLSLILLIGIGTIILLNKKLNIPAVGTIWIILGLVFCIMITNWLSDWAALDVSRREVNYWTLMIRYALYPLIVCLELFTLLDGTIKRILLFVPAAVNAFMMLVLPSISGFVVVWYDEQNRYHSNDWHILPFIVTAFYLILWLAETFIYFKKYKDRRSVIALLTVVITLLTMFLEYENLIENAIFNVMVIDIYLYYFYLSTVYQRKVDEEMQQKKKELTEVKLKLLQEQLSPHFTYNALTIIKSLVYEDPEQAAQTIDDFSTYLRQNVNALKHSENTIPFTKELEHMKGNRQINHRIALHPENVRKYKQKRSVRL